MTDRPIIFSGPMIRALIDGRKTQTRRCLSSKSGTGPAQSVECISGYWMACEYDRRWPIRLPYASGDRLWVREDWRTSPAYDDLKPSEMCGGESICYAADGAWESWGWGNTGCVEGGRPRPSIHMPRWASRLTLTVTDVRVQRLQEISEADAIAEGIAPTDASDPHPFGRWKDYSGEADYFIAPQNSFRSLWDSLNAERGFGWDANPWVVALTFAVHRRNIDQMGEVPA